MNEERNFKNGKLIKLRTGSNAVQGVIVKS